MRTERGVIARFAAAGAVAIAAAELASVADSPAFAVVKEVAPPPVPASCSAPALRKLRSEGETLLKGKNPSLAVQPLRKRLDECYSPVVQRVDLPARPTRKDAIAAYYSVAATYLEAELKTGRVGECVRDGRDWTESAYNPFVGNSVGKTPEGKALLHRLELCAQARVPLVEGFSSSPCKLPGYAKNARAVDVPAGALPAGASAGCLLIFPGKEAAVDGAADPSECHGVRWVLRAADGGGVAERSLTARAGELANCDGSICGPERVGFKRLGGESRVHLFGHAGYCEGGAGSLDWDGIYRISGDSLSLDLVSEVVTPLR